MNKEARQLQDAKEELVYAFRTYEKILALRRKDLAELNHLKSMSKLNSDQKKIIPLLAMLVDQAEESLEDAHKVQKEITSHETKAKNREAVSKVVHDYKLLTKSVTEGAGAILEPTEGNAKNINKVTTQIYNSVAKKSILWRKLGAGLQVLAGFAVFMSTLLMIAIVSGCTMGAALPISIIIGIAGGVVSGGLVGRGISRFFDDKDDDKRKTEIEVRVEKYNDLKNDIKNLKNHTGEEAPEHKVTKASKKESHHEEKGESGHRRAHFK